MSLSSLERQIIDKTGLNIILLGFGMKKRQFLNRLLKISQMNDSINPGKNLSIQAYASKELEALRSQPIITQLLPSQVCRMASDHRGTKNKEITFTTHEIISSKVLIHTKASSNPCRRVSSIRRMKTNPTPKILPTSPVQDLAVLASQSLANHSMYDDGSMKNYHSNSVCYDANQNSSHYLQIKEIQPQVHASKRVYQDQLKVKRTSTRLNQLQTRTKKNSLTEPTSQVERNNRLNTQRRFVIQNNNQNKMKYQKFSLSNEMHKDNIVSLNFNRQKIQFSNKIKLSVRRQINKNYTKHFMPPPKLTAKSYIIYQVKQNMQDSKVIVAFNSKNSQQVASLTKIMTCIITLQLCRDFQINKAAEEVIIGKMQSNVGGTTAQLSHGEIYSIQQLLYGLMLPSGNDASTTLAIWGGKKLLQNQGMFNSKGTNVKFSKVQCYNRFIAYMNQKAKELRLNKTNYANSHGLVNSNNKSSAYDIAILCQYGMRNIEFRNIVQSKHYKSQIRFNQQSKKYQEKLYRTQQEIQVGSDKQITQKSVSPLKKKVSPRSLKLSQKKIPIQWQNTHKLLHLKPKEYIGIKTGYTSSAGPCLSSYLSISNRNFIIIVLGCGKVSLRFKQTQVLRKWLIKHECLKRKKVKASNKIAASQSSQIDDQQQKEQQEMELIIQNMKVDQQKED